MLRLIWCLVLFGGAASSQMTGQNTGTKQAAAPPSAPDIASTTDTPKFEVATIKPSDPKNCCGYFWNLDGLRFKTGNTNLRWLIRFAYGLNDKQIVGEPVWAEDELFDVTAAFAGTKPPTDLECRHALQSLITERFGLKLHHDSREMSAYVLTAPRGSTKLIPSDPNNGSKQELIFTRTGESGKTMHGLGRKVSLHDFAGEIQRLTLNRPLVDRTGLAGSFDIDLDFTLEDPNSLGMSELPDNGAPNLLTAINQQLGLKLAVEKAAVDVIVIDRAEEPSAN